MNVELKAYYQMEDKVANPKHYNWFKEKYGVDSLELVQDFSFNLGNVFKYCLRAGHKEEEGYTLQEKEIEDLKKAYFYLGKEITRLTKKYKI
jgi:Protein of unknwon function (DUF3310)